MQTGLILMQRLHRLVRSGYRPWLGYDVAGGQDRSIELHRKKEVAILHPDASLTVAGRLISADDHASFDARFPPNAPNQRNLTRRLYEMGL